MRIMLVDDEPLLLKSFTRYLGGVCGHDVICAHGGGEALVLSKPVRQAAFDKILADVGSV
jgi:CheY-like chemotaxis protein